MSHKISEAVMAMAAGPDEKPEENNKAIPTIARITAVKYIAELILREFPLPIPTKTANGEIVVKTSINIPNMANKTLLSLSSGGED